MSWYYIHFNRRSIAAKRYEIIERNTIISHYHYMVYPNIGKGVCAIFSIPYLLPFSVAQANLFYVVSTKK